MAKASLRELFHVIARAVPEEQTLVSVALKTPVREALEIMTLHNVSQLPVVEGTSSFGVFSYRSFAQRLCRMSDLKSDPLALPVEEFLENLRFATVRDELAGLLDDFDARDAVLVGSDEKLQGIVTTIDALRYFYKVASPYVLLREIELAIRALILHSLDPDEVQACIDRTLSGRYGEPGKQLPSCLEELTLADTITIVRFKGHWERFSKAFGGTVDTTAARLSLLPQLRNAVFHFRRELTVAEYDTLRDTRDWLFKRIHRIEAARRSADDVV